MTMRLQRVLVPDELAGYHPYTNAYRLPGSERFSDFGGGDPRSPAVLRARAADLRWSGERASLAAELAEYLRGLEAPAPAVENARALGDPGTVAIVAGHQPGLCGGPLFLALKLMSVIRLCELLNREPGPRFVPVYWNGSEDHNRSQFSRLTVFDQAHDLAHLELPPPADSAARTAAGIPAAEAGPLLEELARLLPRTDFLPALLDELRACMQGSLGEMQSRLMCRWFGPAGLVVVEPRVLRRRGAGVIGRALEHAADLRACIERDTAWMREAGYPPPLPVPEPGRSLVYYVREERRERLRVREDGGFELEETGRGWKREELLRELDEHPERFSPSAALRPALQAAVLPVAAYVAGGGELAYHLQLRRLFSALEVRMPLLVPRAAATILKPSLVKTMRRLGLEAADLLRPGWEWEHVTARGEGRARGMREAFAGFERNLRAAAGALESDLREMGVSGLRELERECERFLGRMQGLEKRLRSQDPLLGDRARQQYYRLRKFVLPGGKLQELSTWTVYFLALFGPELLPAVQERLDPLTHLHHVFLVE